MKLRHKFRSSRSTPVSHGVQRRMISVVFFCIFLRLLFFLFIVAICDLVHDVETIFHLSYTTSRLLMEYKHSP